MSGRFLLPPFLLAAWGVGVCAPLSLLAQQSTALAAQQKQSSDSGIEQRWSLAAIFRSAWQVEREHAAAPPWQLSLEEQRYVDQVLAVWEQSTGEIERYKCDVKRWQFDRARNTHGHYAESIGIIRFEKPDKGEFKIDQVKKVLSQTQKPVLYAVDPSEPMGEHLICDSDWIHILFENRKVAVGIQLAPDSREQIFHMTPLRLLFGLSAEELKRRFWVRAIPSPQRSEEVWLEVVPKQPGSLTSYSRVQLVLDRKNIRPKGMIVFPPTWSPMSEDREVFEFLNWETSTSVGVNRATGEFISAAVGADWRVELQPYVPSG